MKQIVSFTLKQRVVMNLLFVLLIVIGAFTLLRMPLERYPNIQFGKMYVNTFLPGASPLEVETLVTKEIEEALEDLEEVEFVRSSSYRQRSNIVIKFDDDSDYLARFDDVRLKVLSILDELPDDIETPVFNFLDVNDWFPAISVNVAGDHSNTTLSLVADEVKISLAQLPGVQEVKVNGEYVREYHVVVSQEKLRQMGVTLKEVSEAIGSAGVNYPAGNALTHQGEFILRVDEQYTTPSELLGVIVRKDGDGSFVRLADLASENSFSYRDPFIMTSVNGKDCVTLQVLKHPDGNALFIAREVRELVGELQQTYAKSGVTLTVTQDSSLRIKDSVRVLGVNLLLGIMLVCTIIWLFMGFRNAALTTVGIPFAFLVTMILMYLTGNSVNEVSLFAFVLVSGIIVDDAIVVVENIHRHFLKNKEIGRAIIDGTSEVFLPVVSATLTTVVAFLPMLIMTGMVGDFFAIIHKTICFSLIASILECLFILPCHYYDFGPRSRHSEKMATPPEQMGSRDELSFSGEYYSPEDEGPLMGSFRALTHRLIVLSLQYRYLSLTILLLFFAVGVVMFGASLLGKSNLVRITFFPDNYSLFYAELVGPPGAPLEEVHGNVKKLAGRLMEKGEGQAESALGFAGFYISDDFSPKYGSNLGYVAVTLPTTEKRRFADYPENDVIKHLEDVREYLSTSIPEGYTLSVRPEKDGPPTGKDLSIRILGNSSENVTALASRIERFIRENEMFSDYIVDLSDDQGREARVLRIKVDAEKAAEYNLRVAEVAAMAATVMEGQIVGEMKLPEDVIDIRLMSRKKDDPGIGDLLDLALADFPEGTLTLGDVCTLEHSFEPGYLNRYQRQRAVTLTANIQPGSPVSSPMVVNKVAAYYSTIRTQFPGASLSFAGEHESTQKSFISLAYAFVIAVIVIYVILAAQFQSYIQPLIIISAIVFALTGVIFGTVVSRTLFTVNSFIAVIGVTGVVVNDSLVLVEFINKIYRKGRAKRDAILIATHIRLRPILLTTITTTLGLLPMAIGIPEYSIIWGSMAMTFVTGLCTATFLTIIIIPILWDVLPGKTR